MIKPALPILKSFLGLFVDIAFWIVFFLFLWLVVDMKLIYFNDASIMNFPDFYLTFDFFKEFLYPGGIIEYVNAFISQFFYYSFTGAVVVTVVCASIGFCAVFIFNELNIRKLSMARFVPAVVAAFLYGIYSHYLVIILVLLAVLVFFSIYLYYSRKHPASCWLSFVVLSVVVYVISGFGSLVFALLAVIYELLYKRNFKLVIFYTAVSVLLPYLMFTFVFKNTTLSDAYLNLMPHSWKIKEAESRDSLLMLLHVVYFIVPLVLFLSGLAKILSSSSGKSAARKKEKTVSFSLRRPVLYHGIKFGLLITISAAVVLPFFEKRIKYFLLTSYYSHHENWAKVLEIAPEYKTPNHFINNAVNRALYHSGRLGCDLFSYMQHPDSFMLNSPQHKKIYYKKVDTLFDLGLVNSAEHCLAIDIDTVGERPFMLQTMALIRIIKNDIPAAKAYLNALSKTLFYSDWAKMYLKKIETDPTFADDPFIQQKRASLLKKSYLGFLRDPQVLVYLLDADPKNKMAYEYLMSWALVAKDFNAFVTFLPKISNFDYETIPPIWQQGILAARAIGKKIDPGKYQIDHHTMHVFKDFDVIMKRNFGNKQSAYEELFKKYKDTYFFYLTYIQ